MTTQDAEQKIGAILFEFDGGKRSKKSYVRQARILLQVAEKMDKSFVEAANGQRDAIDWREKFFSLFPSAES